MHTGPSSGRSPLESRLQLGVSAPTTSLEARPSDNPRRPGCTTAAATCFFSRGRAQPGGCCLATTSCTGFPAGEASSTWSS